MYSLEQDTRNAVAGSRVSMGAAILALATSDAVLYRRAWPLALPALITGLAAILILLA